MPPKWIRSFMHADPTGPALRISRRSHSLVRWIEDSGYVLAGRSRELYHEWDDDQPERNVTELQMPIAS